LTPAGPRATAARDTSVQDADLFAAPNYSAWVRGTIRAVENRTGSVTLFGSSISEPTDELVRLVREAFSQNLTSRYISVFSDGNRFVTNAICARYGVKPQQVVTTTGVTSALFMIVKALAGAGSRILIENPGFDLLTSIARETGATVDFIARPAPAFKIDPDSLARQLTTKTSVVMITNLHNPSGVHLTPDEIRAIAAAAARVDAILVVDEVYADFMRPQFSAPAATLAPNIISANSLTKVFGLYALKCGWMIAAPQLLERIQNDSTDGDLGISKLSHAVAAHVLEQAALFDTRWQGILAATRPIVQRHARAMIADGLLEGELPQFGCMYFPKVQGVNDTLGLARALWSRHNLLVAPGEYFGMAGHIRIGFGGDEPGLDEGLTRLHSALKTLRA
jgi:aspartate/methionine/tyrosine aminotransferase